MAKLKMLSMHSIETTPAPLIQEMQEAAMALGSRVLPCIENMSPNVALAALNWLLPAMIRHLVIEDEEELRKAAQSSAMMLINNMEILIEKMKNDEK